MRAIEKNILVVSTREPGNVRRSDNNGQPELLMNGVMDGRGIELGEAIETVSSDGVNLMHSEENEVNVTENENVVPVECAGMEEIDMEEQGDHMEASNSNIWEKEQSEVSIQSEDGSVNCDSNSGEGEKKSKESSECFEVTSIESGHESSELPATTENVIDSLSGVVPGDSHSELEACSSNSTENLGKIVENSDMKADCSKTESNLTSENPTVEDKTTKTNDETARNLPHAGTEATTTSSEQERSVANSSPAEDLSKNGSSTETVASTGDPNSETVSGSVMSEIVSSEPALSSIETTCTTDSTTTEIPGEQTSAKSIDTDVNASTKTGAIEVTYTKSEQCGLSAMVSTDASENGKLEEAASSSLPAEAVPYEDVSENDINSKKEQATDKSVAVCQQDEAMEVDDNNVSSHSVSADIDEPMDQSEQLTDS
jgi:serine/threonine-protein phosphatase 4 regulatory subunit 2